MRKQISAYSKTNKLLFMFRHIQQLINSTYMCNLLLHFLKLYINFNAWIKKLIYRSVCYFYYYFIGFLKFQPKNLWIAPPQVWQFFFFVTMYYWSLDKLEYKLLWERMEASSVGYEPLWELQFYGFANEQYKKAIFFENSLNTLQFQFDRTFYWWMF